MPLEKLLTMAEVADILSVTTKTLLSHVREGRIRYVKVGNGIARENRRFRPSDVEAFIREQSRLCLPVDQRATRAKRRKLTSSTSSTPEGGFRALREQRQGGMREMLAKEQHNKKYPSRSD